MRYKILIFVIVLAVIILLANYAIGRIIAGILDDVIQEQVEYRLPDAEVRYDRVGVNPVLARVHLDNIHLANPDTYLFQNQRAGIHVSLRDVISAVRSDDPLDEIRSFKITFEQGNWEDIQNNRTVDFTGAEWQFHGNLGQLFGADGRPVAAGHSQRILFTVNRPVLQRFFDQTPIADILNPVPEVTEFQRITGVLQYNPDDGITYLRPLNFESENLDLTINGEFDYPERPSQLLQPRNLNLSFNSESEPGETAIRISEHVGSMRARSATVSGEVSYLHKDEQTWDLNDLDITYALNSPELLPSDRLQREYGSVFQTFGINTSRLPARRWNGSIIQREDGISFRDNEIETAYFDVGINFLVSNADTDEAEINDGRIRVHNQSTAFREFLDDIEMLTGIDLKRENEELLIRMNGPLDNLRFDFGEIADTN